jgi:hypothetical protein
MKYGKGSINEVLVPSRSRRGIYYYEDIEPGLGYDFAFEVHSTLKRSVELPKAWTVLEGEIRRSLVRRFPYGILYLEEQEGVFIVVVMNLHRKPDYWKYRR